MIVTRPDGSVIDRPSDEVIAEALAGYATEVRMQTAAVNALLERLKGQNAQTAPAPVLNSLYDPGDNLGRQGGDYHPVAPGALPQIIDRWGRIRTFAGVLGDWGSVIPLTIAIGETLGPWVSTLPVKRSANVYLADDPARAAGELISIDVCLPSVASAPDRLVTSTTVGGNVRAFVTTFFNATAGQIAPPNPYLFMFPFFRFRSAVAVAATRNFLAHGID